MTDSTFELNTVGWASAPRTAKWPSVIADSTGAPAKVQKDLAASKIADKILVLYLPFDSPSYGVISSKAFTLWDSPEQPQLEAALAKKLGEAKATELIQAAKSAAEANSARSKPQTSGKVMRLVVKRPKPEVAAPLPSEEADMVSPMAAPAHKRARNRKSVTDAQHVVADEAADVDETTTAEPAPASGKKRPRLVLKKPAPDAAAAVVEDANVAVAADVAPVAQPYVDPLELATRAAFAFTGRDVDAGSPSDSSSDEDSPPRKSKKSPAQKSSKKASKPTSPARLKKVKKLASKAVMSDDDESDAEQIRAKKSLRRPDVTAPPSSKRPRIMDSNSEAQLFSEEPDELASEEAKPDTPEKLLEDLLAALRCRSAAGLWTALQKMQKIEVNVVLLKRVKLIDAVKQCSTLKQEDVDLDGTVPSSLSVDSLSTAAKQLLAAWRTACTPASSQKPSKSDQLKTQAAVVRPTAIAKSATASVPVAAAPSVTSAPEDKVGEQSSLATVFDAEVAATMRHKPDDPLRALATQLLATQLSQPLTHTVLGATAGLPAPISNTIKAIAREIVVAVSKVIEFRVWQACGPEDKDGYLASIRGVLVWLSDLEQQRRGLSGVPGAGRAPFGMASYKLLIAALGSAISELKLRAAGSGMEISAGDKEGAITSMIPAIKSLIAQRRVWQFATVQLT